jgi:D-sedoheptulose 7-phosphate isomerase
MDYTKDIENYIACEIKILNSINTGDLNKALNLLQETWEQMGRIYIFGNGGSSATASHFQNDFNKGISEHLQKKFRFTCLTDNTATVMAIANDIGFEEVFRFQIIGQLEPGDIVIAISGSGNSKNVVNAVEYSKFCGNKVIGLTGFDGGRLKELSDISLHAPVNSMQVTEDIHMIFDHLMMSVFYKHLCGLEHLKYSVSMTRSV